MKLREILINSDGLDEFEVIYAKRPWSLNSEACVVQYQPDEMVPRLLSEDCFEYFLETPLIKDIRKQIEDAGGSSSDVLRILLYYAENDAFPE